jgi:hypothetical protein
VGTEVAIRTCSRGLDLAESRWRAPDCVNTRAQCAALHLGCSRFSPSRCRHGCEMVALKRALKMKSCGATAMVLPRTAPCGAPRTTAMR